MFHTLEHRLLLYYLEAHYYELVPSLLSIVPKPLLRKLSFSNMLIRAVTRHADDDQVLMGFAVALYYALKPDLERLLVYGDNPEILQKLGYVLDSINTAYKKCNLIPKCQSELQMIIAELEKQKEKLEPISTVFLISPETEQYKEFLVHQRDGIGEKWDVGDSSRISDYVKALDLYVIHAGIHVINIYTSKIENNAH